jgi:hypothetical protein
MIIQILDRVIYRYIVFLKVAAICIDNIISIDLDVRFRYILDIIYVCNIVNSGLVFSPCR